MSEIPKDIREAARPHVGHHHRWLGPDEVTTLIAHAILAERQRCADVAEGFRQAHDTGSGFDSQSARETAGAIKDIILNPQ